MANDGTSSMTEEEGEYWDNYFTQHPPKLGPNGTGFLSQREARLLGVNDISWGYLKAKSLQTKQSVGALINDFVDKEIAKNMSKEYVRI
jgi:hypothetical protein